jgi:hypothetical protein
MNTEIFFRFQTIKEWPKVCFIIDLEMRTRMHDTMTTAPHQATPPRLRSHRFSKVLDIRFQRFNYAMLRTHTHTDHDDNVFLQHYECCDVC